MTRLRERPEAPPIAAQIPQSVRLLAEFPLTHGPEPPPEAPVERILAPGYGVLVMPGPNGQLVEAVDLGNDVAGRLEDVRELLRQRGRASAVWFTTESSRPVEVHQRLVELGLVRATDPPWEPQFAAMVLVEPPEVGLTDVVARPVASFEEFDAAHELEAEIIGIGDADRQAARDHRRAVWELQESSDSIIRVFLAFVDGELVGVGRSLLGDVAVNLSGGSVRPDVRGRGVYRALVRARWDAAVARGTPALTVQAGAMSRPILERLGFVVVAEQQCLIDRFDVRLDAPS